jgi:UDP-GlcNAc:undecaprenyl-phosphate GlcNAc-1-phosphate transferase
MNTTMAATLSGAAASILTVILVPPIRRICTRWRLYDFPGPLKIHSLPIPRLGGIAIALAIAISTALFSLARPSAILAWPFFAALGLIWLTGLTDDLRGLSPAVRIAAQIVAAFLLWRGGWRLPILGPGALGIAALCLFIIIFVNAFNFLDGSDGLASGVACVIALAYIALPRGMETPFGAAIAWTLLGSCAGFLLSNFPPAKIYMGDSGSTVLGFTVAFLGLDFYRVNAPAAPSLFFPILVSALPLLDAALVVLGRLQRRRSPLTGDRFHFYDQLVIRGWSARKVLLASLCISAAFSVISSACLRCSLAHASLIAASSVIALFAWIVRLGSLRAGEEARQVEEARL